MFTALPLLPPPPSTLLPSSASPYAPSYATESANANNPTTLAQAQQHQQQQIQSRSRPKTASSSARNSSLSLAALSLDERLLEARKRAIAMYGYSWLRPAGCTKTMLGRREEEAEREEVERQLREVEEQEAMQLAGEEELRRMSALARGEAVVEGERDLDEEIPDAEQMVQGGDDEENDTGERDLDEDVPDADEGDRTNMTFGDTTTTTDLLLEGETGIMDEVEGANLGEVRPAMRSGLAGGGAGFREFDAREQEALADAMLDEDEQGMAERGLDDDGVPDGGDRDLDEDVPEADEGEWQHTETEEEMEDEESGMDISILDQSGIAQGRRTAPGRSSMAMPGTAETMGSTGSGRRWFSGGARRNLFGRGTGNLSGLTPPPQHQQAPDSGQVSGAPAAPRRSGRMGRENRARDSLD
jgi:hypothetical protein